MDTIAPAAQFPKVTIYTDGACIRNPGGAGGIGVVLINGSREREIQAHLRSTTNQRAEIIAVCAGLEALKCACEITIITDSKYVINCATGKWGRHSNLDLWERYDQAKALHAHQKIVFEWTKGHSQKNTRNARYNQRCDTLATRAAREGQQAHD